MYSEEFEAEPIALTESTDILTEMSESFIGLPTPEIVAEARRKAMLLRQTT